MEESLTTLGKDPLPLGEKQLFSPSLKSEDSGNGKDGGTGGARRL